MHVEEQGPFECMLATIAALQGLPLADVRKEALKAARIRSARGWEVAVRARQRFWKATEKVAGPTVWPLVQPVKPDEWRNASDGMELPPTGRGVVRRRRGTIRHIAPWENGMVYDPLYPASPQTLQQFVAGAEKFCVREEVR